MGARENFIRALAASITLSGCGAPPRSSCDGFVPMTFSVEADGGTCDALCRERGSACLGHSATKTGAFDCRSVCVGRPPDGLVLSGGGRGLGGHLARVAALEAASVSAFERLARELEAHGGPDTLIAAAKRSADDERRHARTMRRLARARGGTRVHAARAERSVRPLVELARENAISGCVVETYGAFEGTWQSVHATDPSIRRAMGHVAPDEVRHAELSWAVHAWAMRKLTGDQRASIGRDQRAVLQGLRTARLPKFARRLGLPDTASRSALLDALERQLPA